MINIGEHYTILTLQKAVKLGKKAMLTEGAIHKIEDNYQFLHRFIEQSKKPIYGVNTGFGSLCDKEIAKEDLAQLQENLLKSHACGMGNEVPQSIVALMLVLKAQSLSKGFSGVQLQTVQLLIDLYNHQIFPVVYQLGSLGASGDLAPLAHLSLPLIGMGEVYYNGNKVKAADALLAAGLSPIRLQAKEGLALINGTQFMQAYGVHLIADLHKLIGQANTIAALSIDAFDAGLSPFLPQTHAIRPHAGQIYCAAQIFKLLQGSEIAANEKQFVQDPYSFRCVPQVHGATYDALQHINHVFEIEINAVTDNPNVFEQEEMVISAGNFHGQPLALQLDFLCIAAAELASISERRIYKLIAGERGLPAYLISKPGLNSGFMIAQYTAASIVSQNKQYCTPASVDSIMSSNGQEDHVSMGANAATKAFKVIENVNRVLTIELITAAQAMHFRKPKKSSPILETILQSMHKEVPFIEEDVVLGEILNKLNKDEILA